MEKLQKEQGLLIELLNNNHNILNEEIQKHIVDRIYEIEGILDHLYHIN